MNTSDVGSGDYGKGESTIMEKGTAMKEKSCQQFTTKKKVRRYLNQLN